MKQLNVVWAVILALALSASVRCEAAGPAKKKVSAVKIYDASNEPAEMPYFGKKHLLIFYVDPDHANQNKEFRENLEKNQIDSPNIYGFGIVNLKDAPMLPNSIVRAMIRKKVKQTGAAIYTDPDRILSKAWDLGDCNDQFVLLFVKRGKTYVCIKPSMFRPSKQIVKGVCGVGIPASIQNLLNVTGMTILNNFTSAYGSDPVAAMGIAQRVNMVPFQIAMGFSQGIMPLISYNYASGNIKRMKKTFMFTAKISLGFILAVMLTFVFAAEPIISMFMKNESIVAYGAAFLRGFCFALPFLCIDFLALGVFQSCGMGMKSFIFAVVRKIVLEIPALFVLNWLFPLYGLAYAQFVAELILGTIAVVVLVRMFRRLEREHAAPYVSDSESVK